MFMLTFTAALIFFTVFLTIFYFILLTFSTKGRIKLCTRAIPRFLINIASVILLSLILVSMTLSSEKDSPFFQVFYVTVSALLLFVIMLKSVEHEKSKPSAFLLTATILFHIVTLLNSWMTYVFPLDGIAVSERTAAKVKLSLYGHWDQKWKLLNPTYNPFPADVGIHVILSMITSLPLSTYPLNSIIVTLLIITFDITIYILTKKITGNIVTGMIAIILVILTPPLNVAAHIPRSMASLFILIIIYFLLTTPSIKTELLKNLLYVSALFYHFMASQIIFVLISLLIVPYTLSLLNNAIKHELSNNSSNLRKYLVLLLSFLCMSLTKTFWIENAASQIIYPIKTLFNNILNFQSIPETSVPNYEKFASPIYAYSWSIVPSLATAMAMYYLMALIQTIQEKREYSATLELYLASALLLLLGFLAAVLGAGFHPDIYPSMFFMVPMASIAFMKIMKSTRLGSSMLILCLLLASGISIRDPMLNTHSYAKMGGASDVPPKFMNWYIEGTFFAKTIEPCYSLFAPYEMNAYLSYISTINESYNYIFYSGSADLRREVLNKAEEEGEVKSGILYVWPIWWPLGTNVIERITGTGTRLNIFYASGRYIIFMKV